MELHLPKDPGYYEIHPDYNGNPTVFCSHGHDHTWIWIILVVIVILCWKYPEGWEWLGTVEKGYYTVFWARPICPPGCGKRLDTN